MLNDLHELPYLVAVPWPYLEQEQLDWERGVFSIQAWLLDHVGTRYREWAWTDSQNSQTLGVAFRWEIHKTLFVLRWT